MISWAGLTIGPIFDTILNATVPAALWFASYSFSDLTRRLCAKISETIPSAQIVSPYYDREDSLSYDGVGVYHDRIYFSAKCTPEELSETLKTIVDSAKNETVAAFPPLFNREELEGFLSVYLQIHYLVRPDAALGRQNCVLALSDALDAQELMRSFPRTSEGDPYLRLFANEKTRNGNLRLSPLFPVRNEAFFVNGEGNIRSVPELARNGDDSDRKHRRYFAVVNADGDGMGDFLKGLSNEDVKVFSEACIGYAWSAAELIAGFGGMPIYAGGDDLLFLAPVYGRLDRNNALVTELCMAIRKRFNEALKTAFAGREASLCLPTLSFGVSIQYERHPLYEAFEESRNLLEQAKKSGWKDGEKIIKDNLALSLRKHSGQKLSLLIHNPDHEAFRKLASCAEGLSESAQSNSAIYTLGNLRALLEQLVANARQEPPEQAKERFLLRWRNLFDNPDQEQSQSFTDAVGAAFFDMFRPGTTLIRDGSETPTEVTALRTILAFQKFLHEKAGKTDDVPCHV